MRIDPEPAYGMPNPARPRPWGLRRRTAQAARADKKPRRKRFRRGWSGNPQRADAIVDTAELPTAVAVTWLPAARSVLPPVAPVTPTP